MLSCEGIIDAGNETYIKNNYTSFKHILRLENIARQ